MKAIAVDDESLMLYALVKAVKASPDIAEVQDFSDCDKALEWVREHDVDIAFLDINMRGMGGLVLAEKIMENVPKCKVVFCTGHEEYAVPAFKIRASGYLMKPISVEDVQEEINNIKGMQSREKILNVKCFGNFEVTSKGNKLSFKRSKSKEILAYLIDRNGAGVTAMEISVVLWGDDAGEKSHNYFHQLLLDLRQSLEAVGAAGILEQNNYRYSINTEQIDCDYYRYLQEGKPEFMGEYMTQYSWAEETCGMLWENKKY